ncbi:hypothetical protein, partial [Lyngbya sp. CCY1209]|uniref:hypothetical protein n=1 Tax=Lyngbya sp. CCY1209 TaxID=2886103 RepID=UPI002D204FFF
IASIFNPVGAQGLRPLCALFHLASGKYQIGAYAIRPYKNAIARLCFMCQMEAIAKFLGCDRFNFHLASGEYHIGAYAIRPYKNAIARLGFMRQMEAIAKF